MKWSNGGFSWWLLPLAFLVLGSLSLYPQSIEPLPISPSTTPIEPLPNLSSQTPDQIWQMLWPAWGQLGQLLRKQIEQQQQQAETQQSSASLSQQETQTTGNLQSNLQQASQAQNQASTSTSSAISSSTQSSTAIIQAQISKDQEDRDIKSAVLNLEIQRNGWKIAGITFAIISLGEAVYITGHAMKAW